MKKLTSLVKTDEEILIENQILLSELMKLSLTEIDILRKVNQRKFKGLEFDKEFAIRQSNKELLLEIDNDIKVLFVHSTLLNEVLDLKYNTIF